jgi:hypothetical protein
MECPRNDERVEDGNAPGYGSLVRIPTYILYIPYPSLQARKIGETNKVGPTQPGGVRASHELNRKAFPTVNHL